ncbi:serine hydrolase [Lentibacillus kapialis]|uniref:Serine hydrolase n=1 Tax=Lentibacillus kapialis TaxID=340214 RepID=A0A917Q1G2_9BACI|nr:serine hydrolase [Lentibacillus kapialis]GGK05598.1 serine hydrolase [Lentibacillus kapialis]
MNQHQFETDIHKLISDVASPIGLVIKEDEYSINVHANMTMPAASVIKIPIIMEAFRQAECGNLKLSESLDIPADTKVGGSGVLQALSENVSMTFLDVLTLMIIVSDNTAANIAIKRVGIEHVNRLCRELHCHDTEIQRLFMDMEAAEQGLENVTTAGDMVRFLEEIASPRLLSEESANRIMTIMDRQQLTSKLPGYHTKNAIMIANKTGELSDAEHDTGIFQYQDRTIFAAVLMDGIRDHVAAQQIIARIGKAVIAYLSK